MSNSTEPGTSYGAVIFDLDGVITDTAEYHYRGWQRLADEEGIPFDRDFGDRLRGVSRRESLRLMLGDREVTDEAFDEMAERKNNYYVESLEAVSPDDMLPGARELVEECKRRGLKVAIGSASRNAQLVLRQLEITDMFDEVTDGDDAERSKPEPDLFLHAAREVQVPADRCIVLEDAAAGIEAANAAGMLSVGIGPRDRLDEADLVYGSVADVDLDEMLSTANPRA